MASWVNVTLPGSYSRYFLIASAIIESFTRPACQCCVFHRAGLQFYYQDWLLSLRLAEPTLFIFLTGNHMHKKQRDRSGISILLRQQQHRVNYEPLASFHYRAVFICERAFALGLQFCFSSCKMIQFLILPVSDHYKSVSPVDRFH